MRAVRKSLVLVAASAAFVSGVALADGDGGDNSMSPYYGDSWAALEAHTSNMPSPAEQALQDRADAQTQWSQAREHARVQVQRWRESIAHMLHRDAPAA